jgi:molybdopterin/thiamine biosynthesis adenylyltransferase
VAIDLTKKEDKYHRQKAITWWDQERLRNSHVLVVGAGALGNEIVKNLTLVGVGQISIVDMDQIEHTNLARCVFFREGDENKYKSEVLAAAAAKLNPDVKTFHYSCSVQKLGDAFLDNFDLIVAGLDNREARIWLGAAVRRLGKYWVDGAIEGLMGKAQTFTPFGPCYACTMTSKEWEIVSKRKSCALLGKDEILAGHTPTNATTSSVIAGVQTQEAIKHLAGREDMSALKDKIWRFFGDQMDSFNSVVDPDPDCIYHYDIVKISEHVELPNNLSSLLRAMNISSDGYLSFFNDFVHIAGCPRCHSEDRVGFADLMKGQGSCHSCGEELVVTSFNRVQDSDVAASVPLSKDFWPYSSLVQVCDGNVVTVAIKGA